MKKPLSILLVLIAALVIWLCLSRQKLRLSSALQLTNAVVESFSSQRETNLVETYSNSAPITQMLQPTNAIEATNAVINALTATNLEQWKMAIKGLKPLAGFTLNQHWLAEQRGRKIGLPIILSQGDKTVQYSAVLISVNANNESGDVTQVQIQTPKMDIDETRALGLQLCSLLGHDPSDFLAWCDKVGNHWLDAPAYDGFSVPIPNSNKFNGFGILMTYNNEQPWMINYFITSP